jgi:hypothetical protein
MVKQSEDGVPKTPDHIAQIRDIIFGPLKREYDERFSEIVAELNAEKNNFIARNEELRGLLEEKISAGLNALDQSLRQLSARVQDDHTSLQQLIEKKEQKLVADIAALTQRVDEANTGLRHDLTEARTKLQADLRSAKDEAARNLETQFSQLRETKVSRDVMAEMLQEVAMKLRGVELLEELKKAARRKNGE